MLVCFVVSGCIELPMVTSKFFFSSSVLGPIARGDTITTLVESVVFPACTSVIIGSVFN